MVSLKVQGKRAEAETAPAIWTPLLLRDHNKKSLRNWRIKTTVGLNWMVPDRPTVSSVYIKKKAISSRIARA
jgi:hypothetical protein